MSCVAIGTENTLITKTEMWQGNSAPNGFIIRTIFRKENKNKSKSDFD